MDRIQKRFDELASMADEITESKSHKNVQKPSAIQSLNGPLAYYTSTKATLNSRLMIEWRTSVMSLLSRVFSADSTTYQQFEKATNYKGLTAHSYFEQLKAIFASAKADYEGGYLFDVRNLVHASVFTDELDQAKHFLDAGYKVPAAVIAGTVLETTLRKLCSDQSVSASEKLNSMNDELAKANVYNASRKSQIKAWADIRNNTAHGKPDEFEPSDVARMIDGVRDFVAGQLS